VAADCSVTSKRTQSAVKCSSLIYLCGHRILKLSIRTQQNGHAGYEVLNSSGGGRGLVEAARKSGRDPRTCYATLSIITQVSIRKCERVALTWKFMCVEFTESDNICFENVRPHHSLSRDRSFAFSRASSPANAI